MRGNLIIQWTTFHQPEREESGRVYVLSKYMQAFILRKSPQNLTAGITLGECTLSFECNIALPGRQPSASTARLETIVIALDFILNRTRLWHCQKVCLKIRNIIVIRTTHTAKRAHAPRHYRLPRPRFYFPVLKQGNSEISFAQQALNILNIEQSKVNYTISNIYSYFVKGV